LVLNRLSAILAGALASLTFLSEQRLTYGLIQLFSFGLVDDSEARVASFDLKEQTAR
jgi:hypothetical protein